MTNTAEMSRPEHVRPDRFVDFDFYKDLEPSDPHASVAKLMKEAPAVFWTPRHGGHWVINGHTEIFEAARDTAVFSSAQMGLPPPVFEPKLVPINSDPPEHAKYREPLIKALSPKAMAALQSDIRNLAIELIEKVRPNGRCEFAHEVAEPLPVTIFMKLMGLPLEKLAKYRGWVHESLVSGDPEIRGAANRKITNAMSEIIKARMAERKNDLISTLLDSRIDGRPVTFDEMQSYCNLLFVAGLDTVMNGICYGVRTMAQNLELQAELRADPSKIPDAMEEVLRRYTFTLPGRVMAQDHDAFGVHFRKGERVLLMLPASGLDERAYKNPLTLNPKRENKAHIAFNAGPHRCVGSHLARLEMRILYEEVLARLPEFRIDPNKPPKIHGGQVFGFDSLNLVWNPT